MGQELWYLATMNDGLAIIDVQPAPAPVDYVNPNRRAPSLIIPLRHNDRVTQEVAEQIVAEHNAAIGRVCGLLDCAMCGAQKAFVINPLDGAVGYCMKEQKAWRVTDNKCATAGCWNPKATFGDHCMDCLAQRVDAATQV